MDREYYSIPEAALRLGMSRIAVFKKVKKGQLAALRFGRNWAVPAAALELAAGPAAPARPAGPPPPARSLPKPRKQIPPPPPDTGSDLDSMGWD